MRMTGINWRVKQGKRQHLISILKESIWLLSGEQVTEGVPGMREGKISSSSLKCVRFNFTAD